jgi:titin
VAFTAPGSTGGSTITGYTATCGEQANTGSGSPIVVSGLIPGAEPVA